MLVCSQCALLPYSPHTQMSKEVNTHLYKKSLQELKMDLVAAMPVLYSPKTPVITIYEQGSGLRVFSNPTTLDVWQKGITHNGKFYYTAAKPVSLEKLKEVENSESWRSQVESTFVNGPFHIIEDTPENFIIIKGNEVFSGKAVDGGSQLHVFSMTKFQRGPIEQGVQLDPVENTQVKWWNLVEVRQDPIIFEKSYKDFAKPFPARALAALYLLDPEYAKSRAKHLHDEHVKAVQASGF